jgi:hypothetical protein
MNLFWAMDYLVLALMLICAALGVSRCRCGCCARRTPAR